MYICKKYSMRKIIFYCFFISSFFSWSQTTLVINELDADTPSIDDREFIEIKSMTTDLSVVPHFSTDGYILVFFNGSTNGGDSSYLTLDLAGYSTDSNGLLVLGNLNVNPTPQVIIPDNIIQNGQDAVAIYQASVNDFPDGTLATQTNLIDALVYDTNDADDTVLLNLLGETVQYNDNGTNSNPKSLQRQSDGSYLADVPNPRELNDGSGVIFNAIQITTADTMFNEGNSFVITFTSDEIVTSDLTFNIKLDNGAFITDDFSGVTTITIPNGQNSADTIITLVDDSSNEGDEELIINMFNLIEPVVAFNNFYKIRIIDNDFIEASWGTPVLPTYDMVISTQPEGYYNSLNGKSGQDLRDAIQAIIADEVEVRTHSYADVIDILKEADQNPKNSSQVWLLYTEGERSKLDFQTSSDGTGKWNREHTFPRSRGGFGDWDDFDDLATGINTFIVTNADSLRHANSDAHALRVTDASENSRRSNKHYSTNFDSDEYNGPGDTSNTGSWKGDVARGVLYLELRYNGLQIVNGFPSSSPTGNLGDLATLLTWHASDIPDDYEMNRNNIIYNWQRNRNPLIDLPDLVDYIWGDKVGEVYNGALNTNEVVNNEISVYPNPTKGKVNFLGINENTTVELFSIEGRKLQNVSIDEFGVTNFNLSKGVYFLKFSEQNKTHTKRLIIE